MRFVSLALAMASSFEIARLRYSCSRSSSIECMPSLRPISMSPVSCSQRRSLMQLRTPVFPVRISVAKTRPVPSSFGSRRCETTAERELASWAMICGC